MLDTFNVPDVSCGHCKQTIESALGSVSGIETVAVDLDNKQVDVVYDPTVVDRTGVVRALEAAGYPVAG